MQGASGGEEPGGSEEGQPRGRRRGRDRGQGWGPGRSRYRERGRGGQQRGRGRRPSAQGTDRDAAHSTGSESNPAPTGRQRDTDMPGEGPLSLAFGPGPVPSLHLFPGTTAAAAAAAPTVAAPVTREHSAGPHQRALGTALGEGTQAEPERAPNAPSAEAVLRALILGSQRQPSALLGGNLAQQRPSLPLPLSSALDPHQPGGTPNALQLALQQMQQGPLPAQARPYETPTITNPRSGGGSLHLPQLQQLVAPVASATPGLAGLQLPLPLTNPPGTARSLSGSDVQALLQSLAPPTLPHRTSLSAGTEATTSRGGAMGVPRQQSWGGPHTLHPALQPGSGAQSCSPVLQHLGSLGQPDQSAGAAWGGARSGGPGEAGQQPRSWTSQLPPSAGNRSQLSPGAGGQGQLSTAGKRRLELQEASGGGESSSLLGQGAWGAAGLDLAAEPEAGVSGPGSARGEGSAGEQPAFKRPAIPDLNVRARASWLTHPVAAPPQPAGPGSLAPPPHPSAGLPPVAPTFAVGLASQQPAQRAPPSSAQVGLGSGQPLGQENLVALLGAMGQGASTPQLAQTVQRSPAQVGQGGGEQAGQQDLSFLLGSLSQGASRGQPGVADHAFASIESLKRHLDAFKRSTPSSRQQGSAELGPSQQKSPDLAPGPGPAGGQRQRSLPQEFAPPMAASDRKPEEATLGASLGLYAQQQRQAQTPQLGGGLPAEIRSTHTQGEGMALGSQGVGATTARASLSEGQPAGAPQEAAGGALLLSGGASGSASASDAAEQARSFQGRTGHVGRGSVPEQPTDLQGGMGGQQMGTGGAHTAWASGLGVLARNRSSEIDQKKEEDKDKGDEGPVDVDLHL